MVDKTSGEESIYEQGELLDLGSLAAVGAWILAAAASGAVWDGLKLAAQKVLSKTRGHSICSMQVIPRQCPDPVFTTTHQGFDFTFGCWPILTMA